MRGRKKRRAVCFIISQCIHFEQNTRVHACLHIWPSTINKLCVSLHMLSRQNGKCLLHLVMQYFFLRQQMNCRVSVDLFISTKGLFSQWLLLTCCPSARESLVQCLSIPHIAEPNLLTPNYTYLVTTLHSVLCFLTFFCESYI